MRLSEFDYDLPEELIALRPARPRRAARLLVVGEGPDPATPTLEDRMVAELPEILEPGDLLVFNNTKVIAARLEGLRTRARSEGVGAKIEATLLERLGPARWSALAKPAKRLAPGDVVRFAGALAAEVVERRAGGETVLDFDRSGAELDAAIASSGAPPLPPYIAARRAADARDREDYQSVFAKEAGAVAAPTASLHFDDALLAALDARGVARVEVTLHVGAGTFLPVTVDDVSAHKMHAETGALSEAAADAILTAKREGRRVLPVGTTALRLIEAAARQEGGFAAFAGATDLFILPGFAFRVADGLMTNFHLPRSTLMMLVAAVMGRDAILAAYAHATAARYRFYSYGDASLLLPRR